MLTQFIILTNNIEYTSNIDWVAWGAIFTGAAVVVAIVTFIIAKAFGLNTKVTRVETKVDDLVVTVDKMGNSLEDFKLGILYKLLQRKTPVSLNEEGLKVARESGIAKMVEENYVKILEAVKETNPSNAYQAQEKVLEAVRNLELNEECKNIIETAAFKNGYPTSSLYMLGGYYIRDKVLKDLNFDLKDIDLHDPEKKKDSGNVEKN